MTRDCLPIWIRQGNNNILYCAITLFFLLFFPVFFYRSSSALHRRSSTEILSRLLGHFSVEGVPQCPFFVSGSSRIRTHVLIITKRTPKPLLNLDPPRLNINRIKHFPVKKQAHADIGSDIIRDFILKLESGAFIYKQTSTTCIVHYAIFTPSYASYATILCFASYMHVLHMPCLPMV